MSKPKVITFKNGAILVYRKDTRNDYSSIRVGFNAGHMVNTHNGIAHFLEHMLFKKTKLHDKDELVEIKEKIIPNLNAFTSIDFMLLDFIRTNKLFSKAMELALEGTFNVLVTLKDGRLGYVSLEEVVGNNKEIGARSGGTATTNIKRIQMDDDLIKVARNLGICLGD